MNWIRAWWKRRGERLCAKDHHAWKPCMPPVENFGEGMKFAVNFTLSLYYSYARCKRCGKLGQRLAE